jgi:FAD/FMN-containing dehydrogenase
VVTKFEFRLLPLKRVVAGAITHSINHRRDVIRFFRDFVASAPDELTAGILFGFPLPANVFAIGPVFCGKTKDAEKVLKPLRAFGSPLEDSIKEVSFIEGVSEEEPPPLANYEKDGLFSKLNDDAINAFCEGIDNPPTIYQAGLFEMHGAACRGTSAYPMRRPAFDSYTWGFWRSEADRKRTIAWVDQLWSGIASYADGVYVNDLDADEGKARIRAAYGAGYTRLVALKNKYDPTNFFRMNQNIKPTVTAG